MLKSPASKGQSAIELGILLAMLILVFAYLISITTGHDSQISSYRTKLSAGELGDAVAQAINNAALGGEGTRTTVSIPATLVTGEPLGVRIYGSQRLVEVNWSRGHYRASLMTARANSTNLTGARTISFTNQNGAIRIA